MKSNVYWRGLPPQCVQATSADAGITANSASTRPEIRWPPAGKRRRTYSSEPVKVSPTASGFHRRYESGIEMPVTSCSSPERKNPGWKKGRSPGARSNRLPIRTWCEDSRIHAKYWSWSAGNNPSEPDSGRPRVSSGTRIASEVSDRSTSRASSNGSRPRRAPSAPARERRARWETARFTLSNVVRWAGVGGDFRRPPPFRSLGTAHSHGARRGDQQRLSDPRGGHVAGARADRGAGARAKPDRPLRDRLDHCDDADRAQAGGHRRGLRAAGRGRPGGRIPAGVHARADPVGAVQRADTRGRANPHRGLRGRPAAAAHDRALVPADRVRAAGAAVDLLPAHGLHPPAQPAVARAARDLRGDGAAGARRRGRLVASDRRGGGEPRVGGDVDSGLPLQARPALRPRGDAALRGLLVADPRGDCLRARDQPGPGAGAQARGRAGGSRPPPARPHP